MKNETIKNNRDINKQSSKIINDHIFVTVYWLAYLACLEPAK